MQEGLLALDLAWWITAVELPVLAALFWMIQRVRRDADEAVTDTGRMLGEAVLRMHEALAAYKLEVAQTYASLNLLKDVETRLTEHLIRIEGKLDQAVQSQLRERM